MRLDIYIKQLVEEKVKELIEEDTRTGYSAFEAQKLFDALEVLDKITYRKIISDGRFSTSSKVYAVNRHGRIYRERVSDYRES